MGHLASKPVIIRPFLKPRRVHKRIWTNWNNNLYTNSLILKQKWINLIHNEGKFYFYSKRDELYNNEGMIKRSILQFIKDLEEPFTEQKKKHVLISEIDYRGHIRDLDKKYIYASFRIVEWRKKEYIGDDKCDNCSNQVDDHLDGFNIGNVERRIASCPSQDCNLINKWNDYWNKTNHSWGDLNQKYVIKR